jgi:hypothetical protein
VADGKASQELWCSTISVLGAAPRCTTLYWPVPKSVRGLNLGQKGVFERGSGYLSGKTGALVLHLGVALACTTSTCVDLSGPVVDFQSHPWILGHAREYRRQRMINR